MEDIQAITKLFKQYDINRQAQDVTNVKFKGSVAQVFSNKKNESKEIVTGYFYVDIL